MICARCALVGESSDVTHAIDFKIDGRAMTWKRTNDYRGRHLTPKAMRAYQAMVGSVAYAALARARLARQWPLDARYRLGVVVSRPDLRADGDWDNFGKMISDSCEGVLWGNDRQIDSGSVDKVLGPPGVIVRAAVMPPALAPPFGLVYGQP